MHGAKRKSYELDSGQDTKKHKSRQAPWWQKGPLYHVYPKSFYDSNGDGIGDLEGITMKADYLKSLGITGIWMSPFFKSPMVDNGYDIEDYLQVDPIFGSLDDFKKLIDTFKAKNIKVVIDFVPNHTSDQHECFQKSRQKIHPYTDYYIWKSANEDKVPTNWKSVQISTHSGCCLSVEI